MNGTGAPNFDVLDMILSLLFFFLILLIFVGDKNEIMLPIAQLLSTKNKENASLKSQLSIQIKSILDYHWL